MEPSFFSGFADVAQRVKIFLQYLSQGESTFDADGALEVEAWTLRPSRLFLQAKGSEADAAVTDVLPTIRPPNWCAEALGCSDLV